MFQRSTRRRWLVRQSRSGYHVHDYYLKWLQNNLLDWKQRRAKGQGQRMFLSIVLPRNFGKSITATRCASLWTHLDDPNMSTLIGSATQKLAEDFLSSIAVTISANNPQSWFSWLYGNWRNPAREWTKTAFHHGYRINTALQEPSYDITAVDIGMTGYHHDQHWWDDPIIKNKLREGGTYLDTVHTAFNASYKALQSDGLLVLVCTRYLDNDVAGEKWLNEGIASWDGMECPNTMIFQKIAMGKGLWRVFFWQAEDEVTGKATCPEIMDEERIAYEKASDPEDFVCQYQNNPGTSEHAPLTEQQLRDLFLDYRDLRHSIPIESASVHLDTAFKDAQNIRRGDYSAIVPFLHDSRSNGLMYLHTDLIRASNAWRSEQFTDELVKVLHSLRRQAYPLKCITDEREMGGKIGLYRQNLLSALRGAGLRQIGRFHQFSRQGTQKRARIRKAAALWAEGYVRILLHREPGCQCVDNRKCTHWIIPPEARMLFNQLLRVDVVKHDDLADAAADAFQPEVWRAPTFDTYMNAQEEGAQARGPGDEQLRALSRPLTNEELKTIMDEEENYVGGAINAYEDWLPSRYGLPE